MLFEDCAALTAAHALWNRGLIGAEQLGTAKEVIAIYIRDMSRHERRRLADLVFDVPEPDFDDHPRDSQIVAVEAYRQAIRGSEPRVICPDHSGTGLVSRTGGVGMTADEARKLSADARVRDEEKTKIVLGLWSHAIEEAAKKGARRLRESDLPIPRTPIPEEARESARGVLKADGFTVKLVQCGMNEYTHEVSW